MSGNAPEPSHPDPQPSGPLAGVKVLELSIALTGPYAVALLADQGADVVKIERPGFGDIGRYVGVSVNGTSALYTMCNRGKRSIALDVHRAEGRDIARKLARDADVFVQNFRPGVVDRLGLGYDELSAENPDLVYASLSGFGPEGPYADKSAYDTVIQAYGGLAANQSDPETGAPRFLNQTAADKVTSLYAAQAITAALFARERGRGGQHLHLSMLDAVVSFLWADAAGNEVLLDADGSMKSSFVSNFKPFRFLDGWGITTPTSDADFSGMCKAFGVDGYDDPRVAKIAERSQHPEVTREIMGRCYDAAAKLTTVEAMQRMEEQRVPCGVVLSPAELVDDPHARAIHLFEDSDDPVVGKVRRPRHPARFATTTADLGGPAPALGGQTDDVLRELGLGEQIASLRADGIVA
jgi:crotonobetainyl-CoA:carnitine CoA-transferase CaiB-like acyl-CoA transferase